MTTLSTDTPRDYELGQLNEYNLAADTVIYEGAAVGDDGTGLARPLHAGDLFLGFAEQNVDNSNGLASEQHVRVKQRAKVKLTVANVALTDLGKPVFASDDNTFTLTQGSNSYIGRVCRVESTRSCIVQFDATRGGLGSLTALTDQSGGTASQTLAAIGSSYSQTEIANAIASLTAKINALARQVS